MISIVNMEFPLLVTHLMAVGFETKARVIEMAAVAD